jgi:Rrf2 family cysteine metabolism transcriptional repressor
MILASRRDEGTIRVRDIAEEEGLSEKFLQSILLELKHGHIVKSVRGAKGGYELRRDPHSLRISEIVSLIDGPPALFEEADVLSSLRDRQHHALHQLFLDLRDASARILDGTTLADLIPPTHREETQGIPARPQKTSQDSEH